MIESDDYRSKDGERRRDDEETAGVCRKVQRYLIANTKIGRLEANVSEIREDQKMYQKKLLK